MYDPASEGRSVLVDLFPGHWASPIAVGNSDSITQQK